MAATGTVTAVARRRFDPQGQVIESLGDFPEAVRRVAQERHLPLVDLNAASKQVYQALGVERSKLALLHYPANTFPGHTEPLRDDTRQHFRTGAEDEAHGFSGEILCRGRQRKIKYSSHHSGVRRNPVTQAR